MFFNIYWPKNGLNPWKIKKDQIEIAAARIQAGFEKAQTKFAILTQHGKPVITMDNIISRFPDFAIRIFDSLDDHNFFKCITSVNKSWLAFTIKDEFFYFKSIRITLTHCSNCLRYMRLNLKGLGNNSIVSKSWRVNFCSNR